MLKVSVAPQKRWMAPRARTSLLAPIAILVLLLRSPAALAAEPAWSSLAVSGVKPSPRYLHTAVYDPGSNRMIVFGGRQGGPNDHMQVFGDLWILTNANGAEAAPSQWIRIDAAGPPAPRW